MLLKNKLTREFLYQKYIIEKNSATKIGKEFGCDKSTIRNYLKKYEIPRRTISESRKGSTTSKSLKYKFPKELLFPGVYNQK